MFDFETLMLIVKVIAAIGTTITFFVKAPLWLSLLDRLLLMGVPRTLAREEIDAINNFFKEHEVRLNSVGRFHPKLVPMHCQTEPTIFSQIDNALAETLSRQQVADLKRADDPHAFVLLDHATDDPRPLYVEDKPALSLLCIDRYSQLRAMPKELKDRTLVLGANNLVVVANSSFQFWKRCTFVLHRRKNAQTHTGKVHGFGGGYMAYRLDEMDKKTRRDDCKNLHYTAMRELHEESGLLSVDHVKNYFPIIEERHKKSTRVGDEVGDFGHFTFFFVTRVPSLEQLSYKGDASEGEPVEIKVGKRNIRRAIVSGKWEADAVHPQLRAMLAIWLLSGCPGLPLFHRLYLANTIERKRLLNTLARGGD